MFKIATCRIVSISQMVINIIFEFIFLCEIFLKLWLKQGCLNINVNDKDSFCRVPLIFCVFPALRAVPGTQQAIEAHLYSE